MANKHGRVGVKRPDRRSSPGQARKRERRARTHPWNQNVYEPKQKRGWARGHREVLPPIEEAPVEQVSPSAKLNTNEAAAYIGMSPGYVKDHARELGGEKHGLRWQFDTDGLNAWIAKEK